MPDFTIRSDSIDVEQIMRQIRARIRDKRGVDYTEEQIRELAAAKLERFLDPTGVRSDLLEQFRKRPSLPPGFLYQFEDTTLFDSDKAIVRFFRRLLRPVLKLFFNPNVLSTTLHTQAAFNQYVYAHQPLQFELLHNLVLELTRLGIEVKNLKMRLESVQSRLEFNERRARALEAVVQYKPDAGRSRGEGRDDRRRDARTDGGRGPSSQFSGAPGAQTRPQVRGPQPQAASGTIAAPSVADEGPRGTEAQGGIDPITGGESIRTRRRRRRRGRRATDTFTPAAPGASGAVQPEGESPSADSNKGSHQTPSLPDDRTASHDGETAAPSIADVEEERSLDTRPPLDSGRNAEVAGNNARSEAARLESDTWGAASAAQDGAHTMQTTTPQGQSEQDATHPRSASGTEVSTADHSGETPLGAGSTDDPR
jgi:hypothetical protein